MQSHVLFRKMREYLSELNMVAMDASLLTLASKFSCGNDRIDRFIKTTESLDDKFGKTFVWLSDGGNAIIGFYNITTVSVDCVGDVYKFKMGGAIHINEFAIDSKFQKAKATDDDYFSDLLLRECIERIRCLRDACVGFAFITLQSTCEGRHLYARNNFECIDEDMEIAKWMDKEADCIPMYYSLDYE